MSDQKLADIERGGESTQYESIKTVTRPPQKQTGQLGGDNQHTISEMSEFWKSHNNNTNTTSGGVRYDDSDDEWARKQGFGGFTGNFRSQPDRDQDSDAAKTRRQQGYGPGSNVGA